MAVKQFELDRLEKIRREIANELGHKDGDSAVDYMWTDDWIEAVCKALSTHLTSQTPGDTEAGKREKSLLVLATQALFAKHSGSKGDHLLAQELLDRVPELVEPKGQKPDKAQIDRLRQRIIRLRNRYGVDQDWLDKIGAVTPEIDAVTPEIGVGTPETVGAAMSKSAIEHVKQIKGVQSQNSPDPRENNELYVLRKADDLVEKAAETTGNTFIIHGPRGFGKSTLLARYRWLCEQHGKQVALIDLRAYREDQLTGLGEFLAATADNLRIARTPEQSINRAKDLTELVEKYVLESCEAPIVFLFDHIDRLTEREYRDDVFAMLRLWHNHRGDIHTDLWRRTDLVLVTAMSPVALIEDPTYSPFAVGRIIGLDPLSLDECKRLRDSRADKHRLSDEEVAALHELVAGIPALVKRAFEMLTGHAPPTWPDFNDAAADLYGPFREYLLAWKKSLTLYPDLETVYRDFIADKKHVWPRPKYEEREHVQQLERLLALGLVRLDKVGRPKPASPLHVRYFTNA